jgi:hypothetical protein
MIKSFGWVCALWIIKSKIFLPVMAASVLKNLLIKRLLETLVKDIYDKGM